MDTSQAVTHLGLCAGYGGIELGLKRAIPSLRTVALCEIEAFAISNLVAKMEAGLMDPAPIWPDLKTFPWAAFRDRVDILTGGYPCQPFSAAGQRRGKDDPRHLWPYIADGIRLLRPWCCFFENVEGHISLGLSDVIEDLAGMGYRTTWGIFSASECGAPHQRKRVFILAYRCDKGLQGREWFREAGTEGTPSRHASQCNGSMAVASGLGGAPGLSGPFPRHEGQSGESDDGSDQGMADTKCGGLVAGRIDAGKLQGSQSEHCSAWPSRPGEQQYGWEPPRVITGREALDDSQERCLRDDGDNERQTVGTCDTTNNSGLCSGEAMADNHRVDRSAPAEGREHDQQAGPAGEELGDTEGRDGLGSAQWDPGYAAQPDEGMREAVMANTGISGSDRRSDGSSGRIRQPGEVSVDVAGFGGQGNGMRQAQPPLGGDPDGPASGMDYAELCVTCDNRTDELRLLGNGVVPATAERAFRILMSELDIDHPVS